MSDLIQRAINTIDEQAEKGASLEKTIGQYIIDKSLTNDAEAAKAIADGKTLTACASSVKSKARSQSKNGCAVIEDAVVWSWVREYYGFTAQNTEVQLTAQKTAAAEPIDLLDFM